MSVKFVTGNLFDSECEAIVNPVNCVGIMGRGLALEFRKRYREVHQSYVSACYTHQLVIGKVFTVPLEDDPYFKYIVHFPTKYHWSADSKLEYIELALPSLLETIDFFEIKSIALPALGCGNGRLRWEDVKPLLINAFEDLHEVNVKIYEPIGLKKNEDQ